MTDEANYATCPACGEVVFHYFDRNPEGVYPDPVFECCNCLHQFRAYELKGIGWTEVPF